MGVHSVTGHGDRCVARWVLFLTLLSWVYLWSPVLHRCRNVPMVPGSAPHLFRPCETYGHQLHRLPWLLCIRRHGLRSGSGFIPGMGERDCWRLTHGQFAGGKATRSMQRGRSRQGWLAWAGWVSRNRRVQRGGEGNEAAGEQVQVAEAPTRHGHLQ